MVNVASDAMIMAPIPRQHTLEQQALVQGALGISASARELHSYLEVFNERLLDHHWRCNNLGSPVISQTCHDTLVDLLTTMKSSPNCTKECLTHAISASRSIDSEVAKLEEGFFLEAAVQLLAMVRCSKIYYGRDASQMPWRSDESFSSYLCRVFPYEAKMLHDIAGEGFGDGIRLNAAQLVRYSHVCFMPTNNLAEHLLYEPSKKGVWLFLHTGFLHALLRANPMDLSIEQALNEYVLLFVVSIIIMLRRL
jgi:hypothetical protein